MLRIFFSNYTISLNRLLITTRLVVPRTLSTFLPLVALFSLFLTGCGGGATDKPNPIDPPATPPDATMTTDIQGQLVLPDGATPLSNATVYIKSFASTSAKSVLAKSSNQTCDEPSEAYLSYTCTAGDGSFSFSDLEQDNHQLIAYKGAFSVSLMVDTRNDQSGSLTLDTIALDADLKNGDTKMAVVTGLFDSMENVLAKTGFGEVNENGELIVGSETFDIYVGDSEPSWEDDKTAHYESYPLFSTLFDIDDSTGIERIHNYDIVFINCGVNEVDYGSYDSPSVPDAASDFVAPDDEHVIATLQAYVNNGGRLYATDLAYDYIEQAFPSYIDFYADESTPTITEALNEAEAGIADLIVEEATLLDAQLASFLQNTTCTALESEQCLNENGTVYIEGFLSGWAIMNEAHEGATSVQFHVEAEVQSTHYEETFIKPLTASFSVGDGRVFFSSYHSEEHGNIGLLPQERILQYLIFE